ncbi:hypothetical protein Scep_010061 [Stephania cephalantha]|uniref:Uncharacterized protein n=1 Tax=Stephania cephalantha TaxID=152367 RepID=A0AAP0PGQ7_9MAGN
MATVPSIFASSNVCEDGIDSFIDKVVDEGEVFGAPSMPPRYTGLNYPKTSKGKVPVNEPQTSKGKAPIIGKLSLRTLRVAPLLVHFQSPIPYIDLPFAYAHSYRCNSTYIPMEYYKTFVVLEIIHKIRYLNDLRNTANELRHEIPSGTDMLGMNTYKYYLKLESRRPPIRPVANQGKRRFATTFESSSNVYYFLCTQSQHLFRGGVEERARVRVEDKDRFEVEAGIEYELDTETK